MDGIGSISGAVIALLLFPIMGFQNIFLIAFIPGAIAVLLILFIREKHQKKHEIHAKKFTFKTSLKSLPSNLKLFILVSSIFTFGHFGYAFILLRASNIGLEFNTAIFLYVLFYTIYTIFIIPASILSDKIGRKPVIVTGYILFGVTSIGLFFTNNYSMILIMFVIYGIFYAFIDGVQRAFVVDLAPPDLKATALGTFHTAIGIVALPGGLILGLIWDAVSPEIMFIYASILALFSISLFGFIKN